MRPTPVGRGVWLRKAAAPLVASLVALSSVAHAEKADRDKPVQIESDRMEYDDARRISTFIGRVILTKGTIVIRSDRMVVREDTEGFQYGRAEGQPASFRQKREALDEFVEGYGLIIDYDGKAETVTLTSQASLRRLEREQVQDEVHGARIVYQSSAEFYTVEGRAPGALGSDRVRMVIQPRRSGGPDAGGGTPTPSPGAGSPTSGARPATGRTPASSPASSPASPPAQLRPAESLGSTPPGR
jgi:lipopolysaccharide export system protein LptA